MDDNVSRERGLFIIKLNFVDLLTLSGVFLVGLAIALMLAKKFEFALSVLYLAVISDAFDGILARKFGLTRDFGRYLDGFVDTVDYLIAPALFLYLLGFNASWQGMILLVFVCCGFIRLSVFNEIGNIKDEDNGLSYLGAPVFWSTLALGPLFLLSWFVGKDFIFILLTALIPIFSFLMLHNGRYHKFKNPMFMLIALLSMAVLFSVWGMTKAGHNSGLAGFGVANHFYTGILAAIPVIVGGILHMIVVKFDLFSALKIPVHKQLFGANKTWRGFVVMPLACMVGFGLLWLILGDNSNSYTVQFDRYPIWVSGMLIGLAYVIAELPNSFVKRRMGVAPGEVPMKNARLFILMDQLDSGLLCIFAYWLFWSMPTLTCLATLFMAPLIALSIKKILFFMKLKASST